MLREKSCKDKMNNTIPTTNEFIGKKTKRKNIISNQDDKDKEVIKEILKKENTSIIITKIRNIPHQEGDFASFIYFQLEKRSNKINLFQNNIIDIINNNTDKFEYEILNNENQHISLSKTFFLKYHQIDLFLTNMKDSLQSMQSTTLYLCSKVHYFENEFKNRFFIAVPLIKNKIIDVCIKLL